MNITRCKTFFWLILFTIFPARTLMAGDQTPPTISWGFLIIGLFGGLALFLYGMDKMSAGMKKTAGNQIHLFKEALAERSPEKAQEIMASEKKYLDLESQYRIRHLERLRHERRESLETHSVHLELMDLMKQIIVYSSNIAKTFIASGGQGQPQRAKAGLQSRSLLSGVDFLGGVIQKDY